MNIPPSIVSQAMIPPPLIRNDLQNETKEVSRRTLPAIGKATVPPPVQPRSASNKFVNNTPSVHGGEPNLRPKKTQSLSTNQRNSLNTREQSHRPLTAGFVQQQQLKGEIPNVNKLYHILHRMLLVEGMKLTQAEAEDILKRTQGTLQCRSIENSEQLLLDKKGREFLRNITNQIKNFVCEQNDLRNIVRVQSVARRYLVLKKFRGLDKADLEQLKRRNDNYFSIIRMEEKYVDIIDKTLIENFIIPLRQSDIIAPYECAAIFSNIELISEVHKEFLKKLKALEKNFPFVTGVGNVFLELTPILKAYSVYVSNFKNAINEVERMQSENPKFLNFLSEKTSDWADLSTLLSMPLNRFAQYEHLMQSLVENLKEGSKDYGDCIKSISVLTQSSSVIESSLALSHDTARVQACQRKLRSDGPLNILTPGRILHHELKTKKHTIFLFSDILIIAKPLSKAKRDAQHRMGIKSKEELLQISLNCDIQHVDIADVDSKTIEFKNTGGKVIKIPFVSTEKKVEWLKLFRSTLDEKNRLKVFGVSLMDTINRENKPIPTIIEKITQYISQHQLDYAGIFRVAGYKLEIDKLKKIFDSGGEEVKQLDFTGYAVFSVCDVLKLYLRSLPFPLLGYQLYKPIIDLMKNDSIEDKTSAAKELVKTIAPQAQTVLSYLLQFLRLTASRASVNKMSSSNLSIVFGPSLLWSETNTLECAMDIPYINSFVHILIECDL